jgi:hypothetical protein
MLFNNIGNKLGYVLASIVLLAAQMTPFFVFGGKASADGSGSPVECLDSTANVVGSRTGTANLVTYNAEAGYEVDGVCIKSGNNMFDPDKHSGVLDNGNYENECYTVAGVGTQTVTVTRNFESDNCQGISHIDVVVKPIKGSIKIEKNAISDSSQIFNFTTIGLSTDNSGFTLVDDSTPGLPSRVFDELDSGTYVIEELSTVGWTLESITCTTNLDSIIDKQVGKVIIDLLAGDQVSCKFTNRENEVPEVNYCDPSQRPAGMSIAQWLSMNQIDGSDCFEYEITGRCGYFNATLTKNLTPYNYSFRYVSGNSTPNTSNWEGDGALPVSFAEDHNGGSVEITYYIVGPEKDYFVGFGLPNVWDVNGNTVNVDTDCEDPEPVKLTLRKIVINDNNGTLNADQF